MSGITPSQTVGPFFHYMLTPREYGYPELVGNSLITPDALGERIRIEGRVYDGDGAPVPDAMLEVWQADASGRYASPADPKAPANAAFKGFGRTPTTKDGDYAFDTIKPGRVLGPDGRPMAPHININLFGRGMLRHVFTRLYFADEASNAEDPILALVADPASRATLIARRKIGATPATYVFDLHLQGAKETVFFEC
ncbi:MAG: protocatechuate 3,4-dioxygenase subunit alpha [Alphaproteobacteria bacterium]|nr:protocatechuate 3,4-dioxygenase subunit alpha [Alphaproteobacteria bacterium]